MLNANNAYIYMIVVEFFTEQTYRLFLSVIIKFLAQFLIVFVSVPLKSTIIRNSLMSGGQFFLLSFTLISVKKKLC